MSLSTSHITFLLYVYMIGFSKFVPSLHLGRLIIHCTNRSTPCSFDWQKQFCWFKLGSARLPFWQLCYSQQEELAQCEINCWFISFTFSACKFCPSLRAPPSIGGKA